MDYLAQTLTGRVIKISLVGGIGHLACLTHANSVWPAQAEQAKGF